MENETVPSAGVPSRWTRIADWARRDAAGLVQVVTAVVLTLAAVIGLLFITRGTAVHLVRGVGGDGTPVAPADPDFPTTFALLTGTSLVGGNDVRLALDGNGTYPALWSDLRSAKRTIMVEMYYAEPGRVADTLGTILVERARAGVEVYFLYDAFGSGLSRRYMDRLRGAGVKAVSFRPLRFRNLWVVQNRLHVRAVVVDGRIGWTGGFGIDDKWLGDGHHADQWRETNVRFEGPATLQLESAFIAGWSEATGELLSGRATAPSEGRGTTSAALLYTAPTLGSTAAERFLALSIAGAREKLYITNAYFAPDSNFVRFLTGAAKRGVDVRVLVGGPLTDVRAARLAARARYETLLAAGARVYEYQPSTLHAKTFVVDGRWTSIGTMNFDNRSLSLNDESTLVVLDSATGRAMERVFFDDLRHSKEIDLAEFRRRSWTERVAEWAANQITRLL